MMRSLLANNTEPGSAKPVAGIKDREFPIAWTADSQHVFVQMPGPSDVSIYKVDLESGQRELWQTVTPKDQVGLRPMTNPVSMTPDGRWMAFTYTTQLGQIYRSDSLK
jgi:hypothetical protein